jgi:DNA-binding transcriptional LysR family regulator
MVSSATYENVIPRALRAFRERFPGVELVLQEWSSTQQIALLHSGEIQIGFVRPPLRDAAVELKTVTREPLIAALPAGHRLAGRALVRIADLAHEQWVMTPRGRGLGFSELILRLCLNAGFSPAVAQEANQIHTLVGLVAAGLGVTLVPAPFRNLRRPGVVYRPLEGKPAQAEIAAAFLKSEKGSVLRGFLGVLGEVTG